MVFQNGQSMRPFSMCTCQLLLRDSRAGASGIRRKIMMMQEKLLSRFCFRDIFAFVNGMLQPFSFVYLNRCGRSRHEDNLTQQHLLEPWVCSLQARALINFSHRLSITFIGVQASPNLVSLKQESAVVYSVKIVARLYQMWIQSLPFYLLLLSPSTPSFQTLSFAPQYFNAYLPLFCTSGANKQESLIFTVSEHCSFSKLDNADLFLSRRPVSIIDSFQTY